MLILFSSIFLIFLALTALELDFTRRLRAKTDKADPSKPANAEETKANAAGDDTSAKNVSDKLDDILALLKSAKGNELTAGIELYVKTLVNDVATLRKSLAGDSGGSSKDAISAMDANLKTLNENISSVMNSISTITSDISSINKNMADAIKKISDVLDAIKNLELDKKFDTPKGQAIAGDRKSKKKEEEEEEESEEEEDNEEEEEETEEEEGKNDGKEGEEEKKEEKKEEDGEGKEGDKNKKEAEKDKDSIEIDETFNPPEIEFDENAILKTEDSENVSTPPKEATTPENAKDVVKDTEKETKDKNKDADKSAGDKRKGKLEGNEQLMSKIKELKIKLNSVEAK
ncbi:MAG: hypothetical protein LBP39_02975 [Rickettsiales bacterium]|jgi:hypothetical protein|nr:hypothetical protein [Rickettsiales bacterium]